MAEKLLFWSLVGYYFCLKYFIFFFLTEKGEKQETKAAFDHDLELFILA